MFQPNNSFPTFYTSKYTKPLCLQQPKVIGAQNLAIPGNIIYYLTQNQTKHGNYKLIYCAKHFIKNQKFSIFENITYFQHYLARIHFNFDHIPSKIWVVGQVLQMDAPNIFLDVFPKLCYVNVRILIFDNQIISYKEFCFLVCSGNVRDFYFRRCEIKYSDGKWVELADILLKLLLIENFTYSTTEHRQWCCTLEEGEKMAQLPTLTKLITFDIGYTWPSSFPGSKGYKAFKEKHSFAKFSSNDYT